MAIKPFSDDVVLIREKAGSTAYSFYHTWIGTPHIFMTLMNVLRANKDSERYRDTYTKLKNLMDSFEMEGKDFKEHFLILMPKGVPPVEGEKFNLSYHKEGVSVFDSLNRDAMAMKRSMEIEDLLRVLFADRSYRIHAILESFFESSQKADAFCAAVIEVFKPEEKQEVKELEKIKELTNLNTWVKEKKPLYIGGETSLKAIEMALSGKSIRNAALIGRAGTGKTALVYEFVKRIMDKKVTSGLQGKIVYQLDPGALVAGTRYRGDMEEKLMNILNLLKANPNVILFIDEAHMIVKMGDSDGAASAGNIIKPYITRGEIQIIIATTDEEYAQHIEKDRAFARRFHNINVSEPTREEVEKIIRGIKPSIEEYFHKKGSEDVLEKVLTLADKYAIDQANPAKAINMYELAFANSTVFNEEGEIVFTNDILNAIKIKYDLHLEEQKTEDTAKELKSFLLGQDEPLDRVINNLRFVERGLVDVEKPLTSMIFAGPTGVGKTETAKIIAKKFFGSEKFLIKLNMGEYSMEGDVTKITGASPSFVGHDSQPYLTSAIKQYPSSVVLFDEIEKAHPTVFKALLNILDTGEMTDNHKNRVSFRNAIIIFTTNLGYDKDFAKEKGVGFMKTRTTSKDILSTVEEHFAPEFINRIDDIIVFNGLKKDIAKTLTDRYIKDYERLSETKVTVQPFDYEEILKMADIETYGARSLRRAVRKQMLKILSRNEKADLSGLTIGELKTIAKGLDLKGYTKLSKQELYDLLEQKNLSVSDVDRARFVAEEEFQTF